MVWCVLTIPEGRDYKPLTDEDGGAGGAGGRLRSGVSQRSWGDCWGDLLEGGYPVGLVLTEVLSLVSVF